jgi:hypothetical protein
VPLRIMIALLYLKHAFNESDEGVVERWGETPTLAVLLGLAYFEHRRPATPPPWSSSASCWATKAWKNCWRRPSTWRSSSS